MKSRSQRTQVRFSTKRRNDFCLNGKMKGDGHGVAISFFLRTNKKTPSEIRSAFRFYDRVSYPTLEPLATFLETEVTTNLPS